ncbi:MAG: type II secretion system protein, partial [Desulfosarcinaceae bacterium]|nr:type II secretion system protein [Desulfosarcinaceae bacterium]
MKSMLKYQIVRSSIGNDRGFTLPELLVTMAIMAVLMQIAMISMMEMRRSALDTSAISDSRNLIEAAMMAMVTSSSGSV